MWVPFVLDPLSDFVPKQKPPKGMKPLLTCEPLPDDREKKPPAQPPKKRKRLVPATPALSFDPKRNHVPSGRQEPPAPSPILPRPPASEPPTILYDEPTPFADREIHGQFCNGRDAQKRPRIFSGRSSTEHSTSAYPDATDVSDISSGPPDFYDSPVSHTSSSSPAPSDQSPCAAEFAVQVVDHAQPIYAYGGQVYVQQSVVHQDPYAYPMGPCTDGPAQGYPVQYSDVYGRPGHGVPAYPDNTGYGYRC